MQETISEERRAERETLIETEYTGTHPAIKNTKGTCYYSNGVWFYTPKESGEEYRVDGKNLTCNNLDGWIKCYYTGNKKNWYNFISGGNILGKAYFDTGENVWIFKTQETKELFRMGVGGNLKFIRS